MNLLKHFRRKIFLSVGKKNGFYCLAGLGFGLLVRLRNALYDKGLLKGKKCNAFVISIGSVVAGGTGKTPLTEFFAKQFQKSVKVAILSRGYRSLAEKRNVPTVASLGQGPITSAKECGDEPYLLAKNVPGALVICGKNRFLSAQKAIELGAEVLILDDGMQHRSLERDIEIVTKTDEEPRHFLPRGFLRDDPKRIKQADFVFSKQSLSYQIISSKPIEGEKVALFCGIAKPKQFVESIEGLKATIVSTCFLSDHETMSEKDLQKLAEEAFSLGARFLVCTEKDYVKLDLKNKLALEIVWVRKEIVHIKDREVLEKLMQRRLK